MSDAYNNWDLIKSRLAEMHPDWVIYAITFDHEDEQFAVICEHGAEFVSQYALPNPRKPE
jgi:hypothetical protein